ncbi:hypothetical protein GGI11_008538, partial [Coemansia sp. RSA 2049]
FGASLTLSSMASYIGCLSRAGWDIDRSEDGDGTGVRQRQFFESFVQALTVCKEVQGIVPDFTAFVGKYGLSDEQHSITPKNELAATEALVAGLLDYSVDNRGDVGSWVRKRCLETLLVLYGSDRTLAARMAADMVILLLGRTLRAATEKLDRLRERAGQLLEIILYFQQEFMTPTTTTTTTPKATTGAVVDPPQQHLQKCLAQLRTCIPPPADFNANSDLRYLGGLSIVDDVYQ